MKKYLLVALCGLLIATTGCSKDNDTDQTSSAEATTVVAQTEAAVNQGDLSEDEKKWFAMFEDPIFAQALKNGIEKIMNEKLEGELLENVLNDNLVIDLEQTNPLTNESLPDNYKEQIKSIRGLEKFKMISECEFEGLINVPRDNIMGVLQEAKQNGVIFYITSLKIANTQIDDLSFITEEYRSEIGSVDITNTLIDDEGVEPILASEPQSLEIGGSKVTRLPRFKSLKRLSSIRMPNLIEFDSASLLPILADGGILNFISANNTPLDVEVLKQFTTLSELRIGHPTIDGNFLIALEPKNFEKVNLYLHLTNFSGFAEYIKGNYHPERDIYLFDTSVDKAFLDELIGLSDKDAKGFHLELNNPIWDTSVGPNTIQDGIKIFNLVQVYYKDEATLLANKMPENIKSYFLLAEFAESFR